MDSLLEEESLVDVTLSADGQFIRAHRIVLSACSPYFRTLFKSSFLNEKHPVVILKDVDFDILKSLVEYMYKGEANVPQPMLTSFIQTAESLQVRGLAEGASKQKLEQVAELNKLHNPNEMYKQSLHPTHYSNGSPLKGKEEATQNLPEKTKQTSPSSILAARLAKMVENPPVHMLDFQEHLANLAKRSEHTPPMKKQRKTPTASPSTKKEKNGGSSMISVKKDLLQNNLQISPKTSNVIDTMQVSANISELSLTNNNDESDSDALKIDEDGDYSNDFNKNKQYHESKGELAIIDDNIMDDSEEEIPMEGKELVENSGGQVAGFINPWTGEEMPGMPGGYHDDDSHGETPIFPSIMHSSLLSEGGMIDSKDQMPAKYGCARCGRSYLHQATLVRHQRYECGISASYPCQLCGRKFKRRDVLKGHMEKCINKTNGGPSPITSITTPTIDNSMSPMSIPSMPKMLQISSPTGRIPTTEYLSSFTN